MPPNSDGGDQQDRIHNSAATSLRRQYEVAKRRNANLPDNMSLAPKTSEGRKASGHAERP